MSTGKKGLKGTRIASFREPLAAWQIVVRVLGVACWLYALVEEIRRYGNSNSWAARLVWIGIIATLLTKPRYVRFYERGLSISKAGGFVFLARDQLLTVKLDGDRFIVTGPDATWKGPYSGGIFRIRPKDLRSLRDVLERFQKLPQD
jgi:hypothetical protein